jgi:hypothetical protein
MNKYPVIILIVLSLLAIACNKNFINIKCNKLDISIINDSVSYNYGDTISINLEVYCKSSDISKYPISPKLFSLELVPLEYLVFPMPSMYFKNITKDTLIMLDAYAKDTIQIWFTSDSTIPEGHYAYDIYLHAEVVLGESVYQYDVPSADSIVIDVN